MRARVVVVLAEVGDDHPRLGECPKLLLVEALVAAAAVEALYEAVLPRAAWIDVNRFDPVVGQPALHRFGDELRAVVTAQERRRTVFSDRSCSNQASTSAARNARSGRST